MGFISDYAKNAQKNDLQRSPTDRGEGRRIWRQVFGATDKETSQRRQQEQQIRRESVAGGSWAGSAATGEVSTRRLLQAMRSMAPGGWTDDRYEQSKHFVGIAYLAIHRLCVQWQQAEFAVYHKDPDSPDGKRPVDRSETTPEHDGPYDLVKLLEKPNKQDSFGKWMYRQCQQKYLTGTALTWMVPNELGTPMELYTVPTAVAIPQPAINPDFPDGFWRIQPLYPYGPFSSYPTPTSAVGAPIPAQWMLRHQFPHPLLRYEGYSPLTALRLHLDEVQMMDLSRHYSMRRGINPSAVLNFEDMEQAEPLPEVEIDRIKADFESEQMGPENAGRLFVATPGAKLEPWGGRPVDMDYQSGWDQLTNFCLAGFGITKPAAGMIEDSSYSTLFATMKQLHDLTLNPDVCDFAADLTKALAPFFGDDLVIEIRCKRIDDHEIVFTKVDKISSMKGLPESVIKYQLKLMDLPFDEEMIKDLSEAGEGEQGGMPGMGGTESGTGEPEPQQQEAGGEIPGASEGMESANEEMETADGRKIEASRPRPGNLGQGSLGPRKGMKNLRKKYRKTFSRNGHSKNGHCAGV